MEVRRPAVAVSSQQTACVAAAAAGPLCSAAGELAAHGPLDDMDHSDLTPTPTRHRKCHDTLKAT